LHHITSLMHLEALGFSQILLELAGKSSVVIPHSYWWHSINKLPELSSTRLLDEYSISKFIDSISPIGSSRIHWCLW